MGGRAKRKTPDRESWISEVSTDRLQRYESMLDSGGSIQRVDGSPRLTGQQEYFRDLIQREISKRETS